MLACGFFGQDHKVAVRPYKRETNVEMGRNMDEVIAYCGLTCHTCAIFLATREKDSETKNKMRTEIAQVIKEQYGVEHRAEDIGDCDGCRTEDGRLFCKDCKIRKCAKEKGVENCAYCEQYSCEELEKLFTTDPDAKERLDVIRSRL